MEWINSIAVVSGPTPCILWAGTDVSDDDDVAFMPNKALRKKIILYQSLSGIMFIIYAVKSQKPGLYFNLLIGIFYTSYEFT